MLGLALLAQVTVSIVAQGIPTLSPFIQSDFAITRGQVGLCNSALTAGSFVALTVAGWAVDLYGERVALVWGNLAVGLFCFVVAETSHFVPALLALFGAGMGAAMPTPAGSRTVMLWFSAAQRGMAMGIRQTGIPIGGAIAAASLPALALLLGWRMAVAVAGISCLIAAAVCWQMYHNPPGVADARPVAAAPGKTSFRSLLTRDVLLLGLAGALLPLGQFCLITYLALYLKETQGIPVSTSAALLVGAQIAGALGRIVWGIWSDRIWARRRRPAVLTANILAVAGTLALGWLPQGVPVWLIALIVLVYAFNTIGWHGNWIALLAEQAGPERQGRTIGAAMTIMYPGIIAGPPLFGTLVDLTHNWRLAWTLLALALLVGTALLVPVRESGDLS